MNITIKNFRGVARAEFMLVEGRVTLITGPNGAGKTSCAQAVGAAFSGEMPVEGVKKSEAGVLVRAGAMKGSIEVDCDGEGTITVSYPSGKVTTTGAPAVASVYALGMVDLTRLEPKKAAAVLLEYLKATPTQENLTAALSRIGFTEAQHAALWRDVQNLGWDGAEKLWREKGQRLKGRWETIAGERYGPSKAETWAPAKWATGLEGASEESLTAALTQAREFLEAAIATSAVSADRREALQCDASALVVFQKERDLAKKAKDEAWAASKVAAEALRALPVPAREQAVTPCPHCEQGVVVVGGRLMKPAAVDPTADAEKRAAIEAATKRANIAAQAAGEAASKLAEWERHVTASTNAARELAELPPESKAAEGADLEHCREAVRRAEDELQAFRAYRDAKATHEGIVTNDLVVEQLKPDGLRLRKLSIAIANFNDVLGSICDKAKWGRVRLDASLAFTYDDRQLSLVSASQRFRAAVVVQCALALLDKSAVVVVDAADILDTAGRNGLVMMLRGLPGSIAAMVCMTMNQRDVPFNGGLSYWLENAETHEVKEVKR